MHRFYVPNIEFPNSGALGTDVSGIKPTKHAMSLGGPVARQLKTVLRAEIGDRIRLFDGSGSEWEVQIDGLDKDEVSTTLISTVEPVPEPSIKVTMLLGLARSERIELAIQKCTELGAVRFVLVMSERVQGGATGTPSANRLERWRRIAIEAAEQSGRATVPAVDAPLPIVDAVNQQLADQPVLGMWEEQSSSSSSLNEALKAIKSPKPQKADASDMPGLSKLSALIGPPGGFSVREAKAIQSAGAHLVTLGPRVLRSETAAIAVMTAILYEMGDLGG
ncbi:MAG: RsmE family RNA methyltransferase [Chloroflexi bacterium]|nr:RsmE family RNA methyltransferase [Chloroflexota bacterium]